MIALPVNLLLMKLFLDSFDLRQLRLQLIDLVVILSGALLQLVPEIVIF